MWISRDDPIYVTYERFREEFGGQRVLMIALRSDRLFTPEGLTFVRQITDDIQRVDPVDRVQSLSTANIVTSVPASDSSALRRKPRDLSPGSQVPDPGSRAPDPGSRIPGPGSRAPDPVSPDINDDGGIEVQPLLDKVVDEQAAARVRSRVLADPL